MPVHEGIDIEGGYYYQWGQHGKKYYFDPNDPQDEKDAQEKAARQGRAAHAHGYRG